MQPWFRFYDDVVSDPKVQLLEGELFKLWVNLLCLANKHNGNIPKVEHVAFALRMQPDAVSGGCFTLFQAGLLDRFEGDVYMPHNWAQRQATKGLSTPRVQRFRERQRNVSENGAKRKEREKERETEREITPTGLSLSPEKESARETRAPLEAPRARAPTPPPPDPWLPPTPQEVADNEEAQRLEIIQRRSDREPLIAAIRAKPEGERTPFEKMILRNLQDPTP